MERLVKRRREAVRRAAGVDAEIRQARVHLFSLHRELHPADALFGDLDKVGLLRSHIGDDDEVVLIEEPLLYEILYPVRAADLFVGDKGKADLIFRRKAKLLDREEAVKRGDDLLPVVVHAAAVDAPILDDGLKGIGLPEGTFALGNDVGMRHDPQAAAAPAGEAYDDIRTLAAGGLRVGGGVDLHILKAKFFNLL